MVSRNKVVLSGTMGSPVGEEWQIALHYATGEGGTVIGEAALQTWAVGIAAVLDAGETDYSTLSAYMGTACQMNRVDVYHYPGVGPASSTAGADFSFSGTGTRVNPFSTAMVFTLRTQFAGASYRGRSYFPAVGVTITNSGHLNVNAGAVSEFAELLDDIGDAAPVPLLRPVVYSPTKDVVTPVTSVRLGNVPDHQRRRTQDLPETFLTAPIPA